MAVVMGHFTNNPKHTIRLAQRTNNKAVEGIKTATFTETSSPARTSISIIRDLMRNMETKTIIVIKSLSKTSTVFISLPKISIGLSPNEHSSSIKKGRRQVGKISLTSDKRTRKTSRNTRKSIISMVTQKRRRSGAEAIPRRRKNSGKRGKNGRAGRRPTQMTSFTTRNLCSMSSSMLNGSQRRKKSTKSMSQKRIQISTNRIEDSMPGQKCLLMITPGGHGSIEMFTTPSKSETTKISISLIPATSSTICSATSNNNRKKRRKKA